MGKRPATKYIAKRETRGEEKIKRLQPVHQKPPVGNLVHKHKTINSDMVGKRPATKYIQIS